MSYDRTTRASIVHILPDGMKQTDTQYKYLHTKADFKEERVKMCLVQTSLMRWKRNLPRKFKTFIGERPTIKKT